MQQKTILGQRYVLGEELGRGGIGVVYVGYDRQTGRSVAVKVLRPEHTADEESLARFEQEARIARQISHENVAKVYDFGRDGDTRYLVLELLGPTLKDLLDARKRLPARSAARIVAQVLAGLGAAHRAGIVHRDVKPQNVLFVGQSAASDAFQVKIVDFGIARIASASSYTAAGRFFGTAYYVSPEQASGLPAGAASDIYSAGVLLYQVLTGIVPFDGDSDLVILRRQVEDPPRPPSQIATGIPPRLDAIVLRALEKRPERRWPDAEAMRAALLTYDRPSSEWPESGQTRAVAITSETQALTAVQPRGANGVSGQHPAKLSARPAVPAPAPQRVTSTHGRAWLAPVAFFAVLLVAALLGIMLAFAALGLTPVGAPSRQAPTATAAPTRGPSGQTTASGVSLSAADFDGGCLERTLPSRLVGGTIVLGQASRCPRVVAQFDLTVRPRGQSTLRLTALSSPLGGPEVAVVVNERQVFRGQLALPRDGGRGTASLALADGTLRAGGNRLEVLNLAADAQPALGPWLVLYGADLIAS